MPIKDDAASSIRSRLPALLSELHAPYSADEFDIEVHTYHSFKDMTNTSEFEISFGKRVHLYVNIMIKTYPLLFKMFGQRYLVATLAHELLHYPEMQKTPKTYKMKSIDFPGPDGTKKSNEYADFFVNELKDAIVYSMTPKKYLSDFQEYKLIQETLMSVNDPRMFLREMEKKDRVTITYHCKFIPFISLLYYINTLRGSVISKFIFDSLDRNIGERGSKKEHDAFVLAWNKVDALIAMTMRRQTFDEDLVAITEDLFPAIAAVNDYSFNLSFIIEHGAWR